MSQLISQKRIAAQILKCGVSRVRISQGKEAEEALTRQDIRNLIRTGVIWKVQKKGQSRFYKIKRLEQKKKGRRKGEGSRKGKTAAKRRKKNWLITVRTLRRLLKELKDTGRIERKTYTNVYKKIKGGAFRNKSHLMLYLKERELLKPFEAGKQIQKTGKPKAAKKPAKKKTEIAVKSG